MAKIKLLTSMAGADFVYDFGQIIDVDAATAKRYVEAGIAELVAEPKVETATAKRTTRKAALNYKG